MQLHDVPVGPSKSFAKVFSIGPFAGTKHCPHCNERAEIQGLREHWQDAHGKREEDDLTWNCECGDGMCGTLDAMYFGQGPHRLNGRTGYYCEPCRTGEHHATA